MMSKPAEPKTASTSRDEAVPKLIIEVRAGDAPVIFPLLGPEILVGRLDSVDLVLEDLAVSRVHAKIVREGAERVIIDLESSTGTRVNGVAVTRHTLCDGDLVEIAATRMVYRE